MPIEKNLPVHCAEGSSLGVQGRVLILNQSYEAISICSVKKALILLYLNKAELIARFDNKYINTVNIAVPCPSVIRLLKYLNIPFKRIELSRKNIIRRDNYHCQYCGSKVSLTIDHVIPKAKGGSDSWENMVTACTKCNNKKGNRTPEEAGLKLRSIPQKPNHILFIKQCAGDVDITWRPYLFMD